jgi:hypothetical protein
MRPILIMLNDLDAAAERLKSAVELEDAVSHYHLGYGKAILSPARRG